MAAVCCEACGIVAECQRDSCRLCGGALQPSADSEPADECPNCGLGLLYPERGCPLCLGSVLRVSGEPIPPVERWSVEPLHDGADDAGRDAEDERRIPWRLRWRPGRLALAGGAGLAALVAVLVLWGAPILSPSPDLGVGASAVAASVSGRPAREEAERLNTHGLALAQAGDLDGATRDFLQAIAVDPSYVKSHNNLGVLYKRKGLTVQAMGEYATATQLDPRNPVPHKNLAILYEELSDPCQAVKQYSRYLDLAPHAADADAIRARMASLAGQTTGCRPAGLQDTALSGHA
ncbi:MAG TPA: tetratricopeptide repeat protein [Candidatus Sulfotelmatobacter sp.]|nr:tetratricopeptide repeat protein [Candidatus Sulfotelmatobacter sp.]